MRRILADRPYRSRVARRPPGVMTEDRQPPDDDMTFIRVVIGGLALVWMSIIALLLVNVF
jgi:hypothetical protein